MTRTIAVIGATGFVGSHVMEALAQRGSSVRPVRAPRIGIHSTSEERRAALERLERDIDGCTAVVNAAGLPQAAAAAETLTEANHWMPSIVAEATSQAHRRLVHVSSAAVQGRRSVLDSSPDWAPFSPYSASKAEGERALLNEAEHLCIYRPPGVHGRDRAVTRALVRLAASPLSSVAAPGLSNTPQALVENVADAVALLAVIERDPPRIVHHPSEGLTTNSLMTALGGKPPALVPARLARRTVQALYMASRLHLGLEGQARRVEMLWFGQEQAPSWLSKVGWKAPLPLETWTDLGEAIHRELRNNSS